MYQKHTNRVSNTENPDQTAHKCNGFYSSLDLRCLHMNVCSKNRLNT